MILYNAAYYDQGRLKCYEDLEFDITLTGNGSAVTVQNTQYQLPYSLIKHYTKLDASVVQTSWGESDFSLWNGTTKIFSFNPKTNNSKSIDISIYTEDDDIYIKTSMGASGTGIVHVRLYN